jgi:ABC-type iron transport system FetAB ATPase subunit
MNAFCVQQLTTPHLHGIDLTISPGERVGVTGPSGSGKSLLLRALADMDPFQGELTLGDQTVHRMAAPLWRRRVALLPTTSAWWHDTVAPHFARFETPDYTVLGFPPEAAGWEIRRLSSGERQRLALLRVLAQKPEVLLLDEPTASLDAENTRLAEALICEYGRRHGAPIVWVSHDQKQLKRLCKRTFWMEAGRLSPLYDWEGAA